MTLEQTLATFRADMTRLRTGRQRVGAMWSTWDGPRRQRTGMTIGLEMGGNTVVYSFDLPSDAERPNDYLMRFGRIVSDCGMWHKRKRVRV